MIGRKILAIVGCAAVMAASVGCKKQKFDKKPRKVASTVLTESTETEELVPMPETLETKSKENLPEIDVESDLGPLVDLMYSVTGMSRKDSIATIEAFFGADLGDGVESADFEVDGNGVANVRTYYGIVSYGEYIFNEVCIWSNVRDHNVYKVELICTDKSIQEEYVFEDLALTAQAQKGSLLTDLGYYCGTPRTQKKDRLYIKEETNTYNYGYKCRIIVVDGSDSDHTVLKLRFEDDSVKETN
jgi:hypothetical protein